MIEKVGCAVFAFSDKETKDNSGSFCICEQEKKQDKSIKVDVKKKKDKK